MCTAYKESVGRSMDVCMCALVGVWQVDVYIDVCVAGN